MQVSEIFYTIQGEGPSIGKPAIFLRLAGCHLRCVWCDTKYTWKLNSGKKMSSTEIIEEIKKFPSKHLVITGGEPLIQQNALIELLEKLKGYYIEIETSGSLKSSLDKYVNHYNCSPKLSNSKNKSIKLEKLPVDKTFYKFVVDSEKDIREIRSLITKQKLPEENIFLMPQGTKKREIAQKSKWLAEICKKENLRLSPRLHINLWGNKRKV
ncbi:7-carboxy-7-deazaguanine synthase QueE [Candidatus Peregrinibacteria bacterium]|nr:7-carboxy-7-deazaguanine synthase QueE [Candidatus Peregrinibacteria bacterium]